jgi:hypothetical protein
VTGHPTFEAELGYAVARGAISQTLADFSILARYKDLDEARRQANEVRRGAKIWAHILEASRTRIRDEARIHIRAKSPKNVMLAACHEINRGQNLPEEEVTAVVVEEVWNSLPTESPQWHGR